MTSTETCASSPRAREPPPVSERRKSILYCPTCGFQSHPDENWEIRSNGRSERFVCPECETAVATR